LFGTDGPDMLDMTDLYIVLYFARESGFPELPPPRRHPYVRRMDLLSILVGWGEKLVGGFRQAARADLRIADQARLLRRQLAASFEDWPRGPKTEDELLTWAHNASRGFSVASDSCSNSFSASGFVLFALKNKLPQKRPGTPQKRPNFRAAHTADFANEISSSPRT
jgi:hypothetical protein